MKWVVIEFGHNDGGGLATDNGRTDCPGQSTEVCYSEYDGVNETIYTFPEYLIKASQLYIAKGASVILSTATPDNPWETGTFSWVRNRFQYYPWYVLQRQCNTSPLLGLFVLTICHNRFVASELGGPSAGIYFVDHGDYSAQVMDNLGETVVDDNYPLDHTHTAPYLVSGAAYLSPKLIHNSRNHADENRPTTSRRPSCWDSSVVLVGWALQLSTRPHLLRTQFWETALRTIVQLRL